MVELDDLREHLHDAVDEYLDSNQTRFERIESEYETGDGVVDLYLEDRGGRTAVAMFDPLEDGTLDRERIKQARDGALAVGTAIFVMITEESLFLFEYDNQIKIVTIDCYQYGIGDYESADDVVSTLLAAIHARHEGYQMSKFPRDQLEQYVETQ